MPKPEPRKSIALAPVLDLKAAAPLLDELLAVRGADIEVDGAAVQRVGAQCLQILVAARRAWAADQVEFAIVTPSDSLQSTAALLGVTTDLFDLTEACK